MKIKGLLLITLLATLSLSSCSNHKQDSDVLSSEPESYIDPSESESEDPVTIEPIYDEEPDSVEGVDVLDLSDLYNAFNNFGDNYISTIKGYFNEDGGYDYYRHYQKNYVLNKTGYYLNDVHYLMPESDSYLSICNDGYLNLNSNYYQFSLNGSSKEERLNYILTSNDLKNEVAGKKYQDDLFTLNDLNEDYFIDNGFTRVSRNKYQYSSTETETIFSNFIDICAPGLINEGHYLTFSKVTIELNPDADNILRIRLYVSTTQSGKLIDSHNDNGNKPNWYMLFSETYISQKGTTTFKPADEILK